MQYFAASFRIIDDTTNAATSEESEQQQADSNGSNENSNNSQSENSDSSSSASTVLDSVLAFLNDQIQLMLTDEQYVTRPLRGPFLAKLELLKRLKHRKKDETRLLSEVEPNVQLLEQYYDKFGDKPCCFSDIRPYMELLPAEEQVSVSDVFIKDLKLIKSETYLVLFFSVTKATLR